MTIDQDTAVEITGACTAAWNTGKPEAVAAFHAQDGEIVINRSDPWTGRDGVAQMAAGSYTNVPDLALVCDAVRSAGDHVVHVWTFTGTHSGTGNPLKIEGWEERDFDSGLKVKASRGWYDAAEYARQVAGG